VIVPSTVLDTMTLGDTTGVVALTKMLAAQKSAETHRELAAPKEEPKKKPAAESLGSL
jgi:hypothetical protein